jgi:hypothetical protein
MQESGINNLNCGVGNAYGLFQQTPGDGWGSMSQIMDPSHATRAFLAVAIQINHQSPGLSPGTLAQHVQQSVFCLYPLHFTLPQNHFLSFFFFSDLSFLGKFFFSYIKFPGLAVLT